MNISDYINSIFELFESGSTEAAPTMTTNELHNLNATERKFAPAGSIFLGSTFETYGDRHYYQTPDGEYIYTYYSIGD